MKATYKSPKIDEFLTSITGKDRPSTVYNNKCVNCDNPNLNFKDQLSIKEYRISGLCQTCQDKIFGL